MNVNLTWYFLSCLIDYDTLRALDSDDIPHAVSMSDEEINALPVHKYKNHSDKGPTSNQRQYTHFALFIFELKTPRKDLFIKGPLVESNWLIVVVSTVMGLLFHRAGQHLDQQMRYVCIL